RNASNRWAMTWEDALISSELRGELWRRFHRSVRVLLRADGKPANCYIGVSGYRTVLFRVERRTAQGCAAVALYVGPDVDRENRHLIFGERAVMVLNGVATGGPTKALPVAYDPCSDRFTIGTPLVDQEHMATFFLQRASVLLDSIRAPEPREH